MAAKPISKSKMPPTRTPVKGKPKRRGAQAPDRTTTARTRDEIEDALLGALNNYPDGERAADAVIAKLYDPAMRTRQSRRLLSRAVVEDELAMVAHDLAIVGKWDPLVRDAAIIIQAVTLALLHDARNAFREKNRSERKIIRDARDLSTRLGSFEDRERRLFVASDTPETSIADAYARLGKSIADHIRRGWPPREIAVKALFDFRFSPLREKCAPKELFAAFGISAANRRGPVDEDAPTRKALIGDFERILRVHHERQEEAAPQLRDALLKAVGVSRTDRSNWRAEEDRPKVKPRMVPPKSP